MGAAINHPTASARHGVGRRPQPGNVTLSQRGKIWLAIVIWSATAWGGFYGVVSGICRWMS